MNLTYPTTLVLHALASGVRHGFDVIDATGLPSGTVYPILRRLEREASSPPPGRTPRSRTKNSGRRGATTSSPRPETPSSTRRARAIACPERLRRGCGACVPRGPHDAPPGAPARAAHRPVVSVPVPAAARAGLEARVGGRAPASIRSPAASANLHVDNDHGPARTRPRLAARCCLDQAPVHARRRRCS